MFSSQAAELSLDSPCRAVASVRSDRVDNRFLVGSSQVRQTNHLFALRFHSEVNDLGVDAILEHRTGPVQSIASCPTDATLVVTATQQSNDATLWKIPRDIMTDNSTMRYDHDDSHMPPAVSMEPRAVLSSQSGSPIVHVSWRQPTSETDVSSSSAIGDLLTCDQMGNVQQWDIEFEKIMGVNQVENTTKLSSVQSQMIHARVAWDPHSNGDAAAVTRGGSIRIFDWRMDQSIPNGTAEKFVAHRSSAAVDLDYNPNKPYALATAGTDGLLKFWDLRSTSRPQLVCRGGHSHWIWNVQFNPFHDQLVLSTGTDSLAHLWRISTISSAPLLVSDKSAADKSVGRYEHGDACYGATWGAADAWIYLTVGYEGKAVLHHVPSKEKYKILL